HHAPAPATAEVARTSAAQPARRISLTAQRTRGEVTMAISELVQKMEGTNSALYLIFDGIVTQRLVESAARVGVKGIIGHRTGELGQVPSDVRIGTFRDLGLE
ncbi:MAG: hypothetical protein JRN56_00055, partial [Nitrososphaerota archaeon]|nr:hypothetical protein [Nitrososphaerota archaeon]